MTPSCMKRRRARRRGSTEGHLALVPFIDMLTIMVVFLLLHTADVDVIPNTRNISIPQSVSDLKPRETLVVTVTSDMLYVNGKAIVSVADVLATEGNLVAPLRLALTTQSNRLAKAADAGKPPEREVTIMGDRNTPYAVLKKIMATCTDAEYAKVSLAVLERERRA